MMTADWSHPAPIKPIWPDDPSVRCENCDKLLMERLRGEALIKCPRCRHRRLYKKTVDVETQHA